MSRARNVVLLVVLAGCSSAPTALDYGLKNPVLYVANARVAKFGSHRWGLVDASDGTTTVVLGSDLEFPAESSPLKPIPIENQGERQPLATVSGSSVRVGDGVHIDERSGRREGGLTLEMARSWIIAELEPPASQESGWRVAFHLPPAQGRVVDEDGSLALAASDSRVFEVATRSFVEAPPERPVVKVVGDALVNGGLVILAIPLVALAIATAPIWLPILLIWNPNLGMVPTSCGRPFRVRGRARSACVAEGGEWTANVAPDISALDENDRAELARVWLVEARSEHASIAAFSALSLDLLALGAPPRLVERAHRAALDEIVHARICFALASAYAGEEVGPGSFPEARTRRRSGTDEEELERLAVESLRDGCLNEGFAAELARRSLLETKDEAVRTSLEVIARDEARHVELAWSVLEWCLARGAHGAVERALESAMPTGPALESAVPESDVLLAHGRFSRARLEALFGEVRGSVIDRAAALVSSCAVGA